MPTSSSLVTNLPADFNTFGQGVDTSLQDLLGGTTGQVLSKTSGTNMDFTWVTPADQTPLTTKGDIFAFSTVDARLPAGTNETRLVADSAQTLGLKYVADTTNYAIAAKGDLLAGTAADTLDALTVGTNGQILVADSTASTGLKWATPATGTTFVGASCYTTAQLTVPHDTDTAITYNSEFYDTDSFHSTSSNTSRFTIPAGKAGKYLCSVSIQSDGSASTMGAYLKIRKNGSFLTGTKKDVRGGSEPQNVDFSQVLNLAVSDYIEFFIYQNSGASRNFFSDDALAGAGYGQISYLGA